jgi:hypothetical protein
MGKGMSDAAPIAQEPAQPAPQPETTSPKRMEVNELFDAIYAGYGPAGTDTTQKDAADSIRKFLGQVAGDHPVSKGHNLVLMYDPTEMIKSDADVYDSLTAFKEAKPLLLILYSRGGDIGAAYLIGKLGENTQTTAL